VGRCIRISVSRRADEDTWIWFAWRCVSQASWILRKVHLRTPLYHFSFSKPLSCCLWRTACPIHSEDRWRCVCPLYSSPNGRGTSLLIGWEFLPKVVGYFSPHCKHRAKEREQHACRCQLPGHTCTCLCCIAVVGVYPALYHRGTGTSWMLAYMPSCVSGGKRPFLAEGASGNGLPQYG
jgi:hypothetical protein